MNTIYKPYFSVVIPLYNKAAYVTRTIESILAQSHVTFEMVIVDDGSDDDGLALASRICDRSGATYTAIRQENRGASAARNVGIRQARGTHVVFLDADDELLPGALAKYAELIQRFPECGAFGLGFAIRRGGKNLTVRQQGVRVPCQKVDYLKGVAEGDSYLTASSACVRREVFDAVGFFEEGLVQREDPHMWLRIAMKYEISFCREAMVIYHQDDPGRVCNTHRAVGEYADSRLLNDLVSRGQLVGHRAEYARRLVMNNYLSQAVQNLRSGNAKAAQDCLRNVDWRQVNSKVTYAAVFILARTGAWILADQLVRMRFAVLSRLRRAS